MDDLETMLRPDRDRIGTFDSEQALPAVLAAGRRKRSVRRAGATSLVAAGVAAVAMLVPTGVPGLTVQDVAGTDDAATDTTTPKDVASHDDDPSPEPTSGQVATVEPLPTTATPGPTSPTPGVTEEPTSARVPLALEVTTDRDRYEQGAPVTIQVRACNTSEHAHEEWFADPGWRFRVQVITADDRNIAFGEHPRSETESTEVWQPGECRDFVIVWDQSEGPFEQDGGQQAWEGEHRIELSWWGVAPPPPGMDPGLYDPVGRESVWSGTFTIEPPPSDGPSLPL